MPIMVSAFNDFLQYCLSRSSSKNTKVYELNGAIAKKIIECWIPWWVPKKVGTAYYSGPQQSPRLEILVLQVCIPRVFLGHRPKTLRNWQKNHSMLDANNGCPKIQVVSDVRSSTRRPSAVEDGPKCNARKTKLLKWRKTFTWRFRLLNNGRVWATMKNTVLSRTWTPRSVANFGRV